VIKFPLGVGGGIKYTGEEFTRWVVDSDHPRRKHWYAQTLTCKNAEEVVSAVNGMRWLVKEIQRLDPHFFKDTLNPAHGVSGWDLILTAVKRSMGKP
jgi:hypothetical protein